MSFESEPRSEEDALCVIGPINYRNKNARSDAKSALFFLIPRLLSFLLPASDRSFQLLSAGKFGRLVVLLHAFVMSRAIGRLTGLRWRPGLHRGCGLAYLLRGNALGSFLDLGLLQATRAVECALRFSLVLLVPVRRLCGVWHRMETLARNVRQILHIAEGLS